MSEPPVWQVVASHITAPPDVHQTLLAAAVALDTDGASSADRKANRIYADQLNAFAQVSDIR
jgi:hypothetical protein